MDRPSLTMRHGRPRPPSRSNLRRSVPLTLGYCVIKSALASTASKRLVERRLGARVRNGLYRPVYIAFAFFGAKAVLQEVYRGPHRVLYRAPAPLAYAMRAGQLAMLLATLEGTHQIGPGFFGVPQARALLDGGDPQAEPEAQGPAPAGPDELSRRTVFGVTRHPNNWFPTTIFLLEPTMTDKRATFAATVVVHGLLGSVHEERRLRREYGEAYDRYAASVPFLFGRRRAPVATPDAPPEPVAAMPAEPAVPPAAAAT